LKKILVEKIVAVPWRKRRLEGAEQDALSSVEMKAVTDAELRGALGLHLVTFPDWVLNKNNAPSEAEGIKAVKICDEWHKCKDNGIEPETEEEAQRDFPAHWKRLKAEVVEDGYDGSVADYLEVYCQAPSFFVTVQPLGD
jgi:hypothetical protein